MSVLTIFFSVFLLAALFTDLVSRKIPNFLVGIGLVAAAFLHAAQSGFSGVWTALIATICTAMPAIAVYSLGAIGAGDAKWFAGAGSLLGAKEAVMLLCVSIVVSACAALMAGAVSGKYRKRLSSLLFSWYMLLCFPSKEEALRIIRRGSKGRFPFMVAVFAAWVMFFSDAPHVGFKGVFG